MLRHTFDTIAQRAHERYAERGGRKQPPFPVSFDYLQKVFRFDDESVYVRDDGFERMLKNALNMGLPRNRQSWLYRVNPDAALFEKIVPAGSVAHVPDMFGAFAGVAAMPVATGIKESASAEIFYTKYIDIWKRKGLALGIKKEIYNEYQADAGNVIFAMRGFFNDRDGNFYIHRMGALELGLNDQFTGLRPLIHVQKDRVARHLNFGQAVAESLFREETPDL